MECYEEIKVLGKGAQGKVFLVTHKNNKKQYVIKKVECKDESSVNTAFSEAMSLKDLQHPYICGYKEFFAEWDNVDKAMVVCIVMDYYTSGDLQNLMNIYRKQKKPFEETVIKRWLGQIVEVLKYIHEKGVIHRDLKPSNLFLKDESLDLVVGDFGVATVMGDVRTRTRTAVGSIVWMAPEVTERPYDERSDIWSVGCILLQMLTCQALFEKEINDRLAMMKSNPQILEDLLKVIEKDYSKELVSVVRQLLRRNFEQRPTAGELAKTPYITECLSLTQSSAISRAKKQEVTTKDSPVPVGKGLEAVIQYIKAEKRNEFCAAEALEWVAKQENLKLDNNAEKLIAEVIMEHLVAESVCIHATKIFSVLALRARQDDAMFSADVIKPIIAASKSHSGCQEIQANVVRFALRLSVYESAAVILGKLGAVQCILDAMRTFPNAEELNANACHALYSLCVEVANAGIAVSEGGLATVCSCMRVHNTSSHVHEHGASAILALVVEDESLREAEEMKLVHLLLTSISTFIGFTSLVKNALMALSSLVEDVHLAISFIECQDGGPKTSMQGIHEMRRLYDVHYDNVEVVSVLCELLDFLVKHEDLISLLTGIPELRQLINDISERFKKDKKIQKACGSAIESLEV